MPRTNTVAAQATSLPPEEEATLERALNRVWNTIAEDYLQMFPRRKCSGKDVQSAVPDHLYCYAGETAAQSKTIEELWKRLSWPAQNRLLAKCFPSKNSYCL